MYSKQYLFILLLVSFIVIIHCASQVINETESIKASSNEMKVEKKIKVYSPNKLPNGMIGLYTRKGQALQDEALVINYNMISRFSNQVNRKYSGPASLALLMNALNFGVHIKFQSVTRHSNEEKALMEDIVAGTVRVTEDEVLHQPRAAEFVKTLNVKKNGMTLAEVANLAMYSGLGVNTHYAGSALSESSKKKVPQRNIFHSINDFKDFAIDYMSRRATGLIVNYDLGTLGYTGLKGNFSPLAAYHTQSDRFLVMDVSQDTPPAWVKTKDLFKAMSAMDNDSGLSRGLLHIHELLF